VHLPIRDCREVPLTVQGPAPPADDVQLAAAPFSHRRTDAEEQHRLTNAAPGRTFNRPSGLVARVRSWDDYLRAAQVLLYNVQHNLRDDVSGRLHASIPLRETRAGQIMFKVPSHGPADAQPAQAMTNHAQGAQNWRMTVADLLLQDNFWRAERWRRPAIDNYTPPEFDLAGVLYGGYSKHQRFFYAGAEACTVAPYPFVDDVTKLRVNHFVVGSEDTRHRLRSDVYRYAQLYEPWNGRAGSIMGYYERIQAGEEFYYLTGSLTLDGLYQQITALLAHFWHRHGPAELGRQLPDTRYNPVKYFTPAERDHIGVINDAQRWRGQPNAPPPGQIGDERAVLYQDWRRSLRPFEDWQGFQTADDYAPVREPNESAAEWAQRKAGLQAPVQDELMPAAGDPAHVVDGVVPLEIDQINQPLRVNQDPVVPRMTLNGCFTILMEGVFQTRRDLAPMEPIKPAVWPPADPSDVPRMTDMYEYSPSSFEVADTRPTLRNDENDEIQQLVPGLAFAHGQQQLPWRRLFHVRTPVPPNVLGEDMSFLRANCLIRARHRMLDYVMKVANNDADNSSATFIPVRVRIQWRVGPPPPVGGCAGQRGPGYNRLLSGLMETAKTIWPVITSQHPTRYDCGLIAIWRSMVYMQHHGSVNGEQNQLRADHIRWMCWIAGVSDSDPCWAAWAAKKKTKKAGDPNLNDFEKNVLTRRVVDWLQDDALATSMMQGPGWTWPQLQQVAHRLRIRIGVLESRVVERRGEQEKRQCRVVFKTRSRHAAVNSYEAHQSSASETVAVAASATTSDAMEVTTDNNDNDGNDDGDDHGDVAAEIGPSAAPWNWTPTNTVPLATTTATTADHPLHLWLQEPWIYLLQTGQHYDAILHVENYFKTKTGTRKWCNWCSRIYAGDRHQCPLRCRVCWTVGCDALAGAMTGAWTKCDQCRREFPTRACFDHHVANGQCQRFYACHCTRKLLKTKAGDGVMGRDAQHHVCGEICCPVCHQWFQPTTVDHRCTMKKAKIKSVTQPEDILTWDVETTLNELNMQMVNQITLLRGPWVPGCSTLEHFDNMPAFLIRLRQLARASSRPLYAFAHNGAKFDVQLLNRDLLRMPPMPNEGEEDYYRWKIIGLLMRGLKVIQQIMGFEICAERGTPMSDLAAATNTTGFSNLTFLDSMCHIPGSLDSACKSYGVKTTKSFFPHRFNRAGRGWNMTDGLETGYSGPIPPAAYFLPPDPTCEAKFLAAANQVGEIQAWLADYLQRGSGGGDYWSTSFSVWYAQQALKTIQRVEDLPWGYLPATVTADLIKRYPDLVGANHHFEGEWKFRYEIREYCALDVICLSQLLFTYREQLITIQQRRIRHLQQSRRRTTSQVEQSELGSLSTKKKRGARYRLVDPLTTITVAGTAIRLFKELYQPAGQRIGQLTPNQNYDCMQWMFGARCEAFATKCHAPIGSGRRIVHIDACSLYPTVMWSDLLPTGNITYEGSNAETYLYWYLNAVAGTELADRITTTILPQVLDAACQADASSVCPWHADERDLQVVMCNPAERQREQMTASVIEEMMERGTLVSQLVEELRSARHQFRLYSPRKSLAAQVEELVTTADAHRLVVLLQVDVTCPQDLELPVLPSRHHGRLMFDLLDKTAEFYTSFELAAALAVGYQVRRIYRCIVFGSRETSDTLFHDWVGEFFALKAMSSDYHDAAVLAATRQDLMSMGITAEQMSAPGAFTSRPAQRQVAKLKLNSLFGKFGERNNTTQREIFSHDSAEDCAKANGLIHDESEEVWFSEISASHFFASHAKVEGPKRVVSDNTHAALALCVLARARLRLLKGLQGLHPSQLLYSDTDSIFYVVDESDPRHVAQPVGMTFGQRLGDFTYEHEQVGIECLYAVASKSYFIKQHDGRVEVKAKGFAMREMKERDFSELADNMADLLMNDAASQQRLVLKYPVSMMKPEPGFGGVSSLQQIKTFRSNPKRLPTPDQRCEWRQGTRPVNEARIAALSTAQKVLMGYVANKGDFSLDKLVHEYERLLSINDESTATTTTTTTPTAVTAMIGEPQVPDELMVVERQGMVQYLPGDAELKEDDQVWCRVTGFAAPQRDVPLLAKLLICYPLVDDGGLPLTGSSLRERVMLVLRFHLVGKLGSARIC
jgi:hypothetical protein